MTGRAALAGRVLAILSRDRASTDAELAAELAVTPAELSPVIGLLYRQRRADRCHRYLVPLPPLAPAAPPAAGPEDAVTPPADPALLDAALACAARGWPVFPLRPATKRPAFPDHTAAHCTRIDPRCHEGHAGWEARATTDPERIARAWTCAAYNIGIATGPAGLVVLDLDQPKPGETPPAAWDQPGIRDGRDVLAALAEQHGHAQAFPGLMDTFLVATARGGLHLYYLPQPGQPPPRNTAHALGWLIDTRARGGYVVAPGSVVTLPSGGTGRYHVVYDRPPAGLPDWLAALITPPAIAAAPVECQRPPAAIAAPAYGDAALRGEVQRVLTSPDHGHNRALNKAAFNLGRRIAAGALDRGPAEQALQAAGEATQASEPPVRIAAVIRAGMDAGIRQATSAATSHPGAAV
jgi:Bifunctional DNA primase/polymerase, N-terminal